MVASISGSAVADTAAVAALLIPMMRAAGYDVPRAAGLIAAGGIIAPVIPPSIAFVVFGVAAQVSITKLFLAGIFPGLMMARGAGVHLVAVSRRRSRVAVAPGVSMREAAPRRWPTASGRWLLPGVIIGGMKFGVFTPTEAAVVAVVYALLVGRFVYGELKFERPARADAVGGQDLEHGDVPGGLRAGVGLADHHRRHPGAGDGAARPSWATRSC